MRRYPTVLAAINDEDSLRVHRCHCKFQSGVEYRQRLAPQTRARHLRHPVKCASVRIDLRRTEIATILLKDKVLTILQADGVAPDGHVKSSGLHQTRHFLHAGPLFKLTKKLNFTLQT